MKPWVQRLLLVVLGGALAWLWLPPGPVPWLVFVADVPFLALLAMNGGKGWKRWAVLYGLVHFAVGMRWLGCVHPVEIPAAALAMVPTTLLFGLGVRLAGHARVPFLLGFGVLCVLEEMLRSVWLGGSPWPTRALAFASEAPAGESLHVLIPAVGWVGAYGLTCLAGTVNAWVFLYARTRSAIEPAPGANRRLWASALVPAGLLLGLGIAGIRQHKAYEGRDAAGTIVRTERPLVAIQAAIDQALKNKAGSVQQIFDEHAELTRLALDMPRPQQPLAVLWPETMVAWPWLNPDLGARFPLAYRDMVAVMRHLKDDVLAGRDIPMFLGVLSRHERAPGDTSARLRELAERDSLVHVYPSRGPGRGELYTRTPPDAPQWRPAWQAPITRHDKVRLVPGGETTPLGDVFPPLRNIRRLVSSIPELTPGASRQRPFELDTDQGTVRLGSIICFDIAFAVRCRTWRRDGAQVLLNAANYAWFQRSSFRAQVRAMARLRAAETGTTVVIAGNSGPTHFVDPIGRPYGAFYEVGDAGIQEVPGAAVRDTTYRRGWSEAPLILDPEMPPYVGWGDIPWAALGALLVLVGLLRRRRSDMLGR